MGMPTEQLKLPRQKILRLQRQFVHKECMEGLGDLENKVILLKFLKYNYFTILKGFLITTLPARNSMR